MSRSRAYRICTRLIVLLLYYEFELCDSRRSLSWTLNLMVSMNELELQFMISNDECAYMPSQRGVTNLSCVTVGTLWYPTVTLIISRDVRIDELELYS